MIVLLKTENKKLNDLFKIPIIGGTIIFLVAIAPVPFMFLINGVFEIVQTEILERGNALIAGGWNVLLAFIFKVKISIFFIPCWILFLVIGILRLFLIIQ